MASTAAFVGSVPENYHRYLGPLLFEPYARDLAARLAIAPGGRVLEVACGTGIVTRAVASGLPAGAKLVATDLNQAMIDEARRQVPAEMLNAPSARRHETSGSGDATSSRVTLRTADAQQLPFADGPFDAVFSQFGVMFFPDKVRAMREARRVLAPRGRFLFNVWESLDRNPMSRTVFETMVRLFPSNPPDFLKTPFGWFDRAEIERVVRAGGFANVTMETVAFPSVAPTADDAARGFVEGSPMSGQLTERGVSDFGPVRRAVAEALGDRHGRAPCQAPMEAIVVTAG
ncbi:MAG: class I SAM-dependent methyltransferase [Phycisphaerales bacterium]